jgi:hypothetical protein
MPDLSPNPDLHACWFCDSTNLDISFQSVQPDDWHSAHVRCHDCEATGPHSIAVEDCWLGKEEARAAAAAAWNSLATRLVNPPPEGGTAPHAQETRPNPQLASPDVSPASTDTQPWPVPDQAVWYPDGSLTTLRPARVMLTFRGKDDRNWCLLELDKDYLTVPALGLHPTGDGPSYFQLALREPAFARQFMQQAGLLDANGDWMPQFRAPADDSGD